MTFFQIFIFVWTIPSKRDQKCKKNTFCIFKLWRMLKIDGGLITLFFPFWDSTSQATHTICVLFPTYYCQLKNKDLSLEKISAINPADEIYSWRTFRSKLSSFQLEFQHSCQVVWCYNECYHHLFLACKHVLKDVISLRKKTVSSLFDLTTK